MIKIKRPKLLVWLLILSYPLICLLLIVFIYHLVYKNKVYPGVYIQNQHLGNWTKNQVKSYFKNKNNSFASVLIAFTWQEKSWTLKAKDINWGYDENKIAQAAFQFGRSKNLLQNTLDKITAFQKKAHLPPSYHYNHLKLYDFLKSINSQIYIPPVNALFQFQNNKVTAFRQAQPGLGLNFNKTLVLLKNQLADNPPHQITIALPVEKIPPQISQANNLGIEKIIGSGTSNFSGSPSPRIFNIDLASSKLHGILIPPNQIFSFNEKIGTVSAQTGYQKAYTIKRGKTVLDDGGGICQVSTTLYRAALYSGLPIIERQPHAYRVSYYEPPVGMDATVYQPEPDLKFKNNTPAHILIQRVINYQTNTLTFHFYGTDDGRQTFINGPYITSQTPPPPPTYQDDPTLPKGQVKQIDTAHPGARTYFERTVKKGSKTLIKETVTSSYVPWPAVFLKGTKE